MHVKSTLRTLTSMDRHTAHTACQLTKDVLRLYSEVVNLTTAEEHLCVKGTF